jgi:rubrerythrin
MPEFSTPFAGLISERKLTREELIRAVRYSISAEYEAIQLYMQLAESIEDELAVKVLRDIADEERVHVGEFLKLLHCLSPDEEQYYAEGAKEVETMMKETSSNKNLKEMNRDSDQKDLPNCRLAPDPEHFRAHDDDEPCDDGRTGKREG